MTADKLSFSSLFTLTDRFAYGKVEEILQLCLVLIILRNLSYWLSLQCHRAAPEGKLFSSNTKQHLRTSQTGTPERFVIIFKHLKADQSWDNTEFMIDFSLFLEQNTILINRCLTSAVPDAEKQCYHLGRGIIHLRENI